MRKSKSVRQILGYFTLLCWGLFATIGIYSEAIACIHDPANKYAGMYFLYPNALGHMWILVETDTGVNDDDNHRVLYLSGSGCADPDWSYHHYDYDYWGDGLGIPAKKDRRLWVIKATGLMPGCFYDAEFKYRDYYSKAGEWLSGCWHSTWGHFSAAPETSSTDPDRLPEELEFYAYGDTRTTECKKDDPDQAEMRNVAAGIMAHHGHHTFILHTGDFVYKGGQPTGFYYFHDGYEKDKKGHTKPEPWLIHENDWQYYTFFSSSKVWEMLRHMPIFPTLGNHEFQDNAVGGKYEPLAGKIRYSKEKNRMYNYRHYFPGFNQGDYIEDQYYGFSYGPLSVWSLTSFPMEGGLYCSENNDNYKPKAEGGTGQYDWLKDQFETYKNDPRQWRIVIMHAPMYSPCDCNKQYDARKYLKPLFEEYGVDLVLTGHEHYYARKTVNDIPYLILGGGGAGLSLCGSCKEVEQCQGFDMVLNKHHFAYLHINRDTMTIEVLNTSNKELDSFTVNRIPVSGFEAAYTETPLAIDFTDKSTGNIYKYDWDFGDGTEHSQEKAPTHTYEQAGKYTVTLTVSSAFNTSTHSVTVEPGPIPDFDADPTEGPLGISVQFTDKSQGDRSEWLWDFGDGFTSTEQDPVHQYNKNGKFTVKLTVRANGISKTKTREDYIGVEPWADFEPRSDSCVHTDQYCEQGFSCYFEFTDKSQGDSLTYHWDFGDGTTSTEQNPSHNFKSDGGSKTYRIQLVVTDINGLTDSAIGYRELICIPTPRHR